MNQLILKKRRYITLIEIMIVMFLIAMITGVLAYNYRGTLEKGKAFKTEQGMEKLRTVLLLAMAENPNAKDEIEQNNWHNLVKTSPLVQNPNDLILDGWGNEYTIEFDSEGNLVITSERYNTYKGID